MKIGYNSLEDSKLEYNSKQHEYGYNSTTLVQIR